MTKALTLLNKLTKSKYLVIAAFGLFVLSPATLQATVDSELQDQADQQLYQQTLAAIKKGHKTRTREGMEQLQHYPLYPYLQQAQLIRQLNTLPYQQVDQFLINHSDSVVGQQLRRRWLTVLAEKKQWPEFISYFRAGNSNGELRCWHIEALHQTGYSQLALDRTAAIWLSGKSQPDACDPVFKRWQEAGYQTDQHVWQRTQLALDNRNTLLARYLSKHASALLKPYTRRLISVHRDPRRLEVTADFTDGSPWSTDIISHGLQRLAARDFELATQLWIDYRGITRFSEQQQFAIRDKIARQIIASGKENALQWLIVHDPNAEDSYLLEWRIRLALKQQMWSQADNWISLLPDKLRNSSRWQYWQARVWQAQSLYPEKAISQLQSLANQRHYYGFLSADLLQQGYGFNHVNMAISQQLQQVANDPAVVRAQQFYKMDKLTSARREWFGAVAHFDQQQLTAATSIAHQWGWHQQAISTTIRANQWNDLSIRFPLAYQNNILDSAKQVTIRPEWIYAIARQESAFGQDAYSSAGARGLMQLLPDTAKQVAQKIGVRYSTSDLYRPEKNITLGSNYLKTLLDDFEGNHILATAAYNAGPRRVKGWLEKQNMVLPHDIWIETLPFHETRNYIQNVLAFSVIYAHRLGIDSPLIAKQDMLIGSIRPVASSP
jgi:soluble lytic murein transglycosylase